MESNNKHSILLVDDEPDILEVLRFNFTMSGYDVTLAASAEEALKLDLSRFSLLILDVMLGGMSGSRMAMQLKENPLTADIPIIMLTAKNSREDIIDGPCRNCCCACRRCFGGPIGRLRPASRPERTAFPWTSGGRV